ncbi:MAG: hybrid sensor histidine kinase/response regulator [Bacteroidia bacterium]|nr:MAG: hybrid sensor histidine kinase/response regulator [Bacteroidia bacterium]
MEKLNLLVVDDEPGIRSGVSRILENYTVSYPFMDEDIGFNVTVAETGEEALDILKSQPMDIVLLDNKLPGIQGIDVLEYINKENMDLVVVMITSYASLELAVKATRQGAYDFVPKPFTPKELRASIETITKQRFLRKMTQKLNVEGRQVRFQFLSVLSHELKSPLNAVEGYLNMIKEKKFGNQVDEYADMIERSLQRIQGMRNLIMDMLDFTRIESGKKKRKIEKINLCEITQQCIDAFQPLSIQKDVDVYLNCSEKIAIDADQQEMEIILNNLISNAIKYNKHGGRVDINLRRENRTVILSVEDTGIGMKEEDTKNLFEDFMRIKSEHTKNISGSGLGLSIVKKLVGLYDATIEVESQPDEGSCFTIIFKNTDS